MEKAKTTFFTAKNITYVAVLVALIIVFQFCSGMMKIGTTTISLVLIPVVFGGMLMGIGVGALLGAVFGLFVIVYALCGFDPFTLFLLGESPVLTVIICLGKGAAAGAVSALAYKLIAKKNKYVAVFAASAIAPIVNTGVFIIGALFMSGLLSSYLTGAGLDVSGMSAIYIVIVICVGVNFFVELAISLVCSPAMYSVHNVVEKQIIKNKKLKAKKNNSDEN